jgi:UDP-N-acetylglucosamine 2-epimerase (non-hydrolysing)
MTTVLLDLIAGARPNFMKIAPIIRAIERRRREGGALRYRLVHTGQHYDDAMSGSFFRQLSIPAPDVNLEVGSGTQAEQTAAIMIRYERLLRDSPSRACIVVGDVTSTMAAAITAQKLRVPVGHVEAGIRSGDWTMPEEINRRVTDSITNWFFTTTEQAGSNLRASGVPADCVHFVGNTMIDTLLEQVPRLQPPAFWDECALAPGGYVVLTLHRPGNVDDPATLGEMLDAVAAAAGGLPVIFPVHPRTAAVLQRLTAVPREIVRVAPQGYLEFIYLVKHARAVVTDSGGVTEETTVLGVPCMTLRDTTERPETVVVGTNELLGTSPSAIAPAFATLFAGRWKQGRCPDLWDGRAGERIVDHLARLVR